MFSIHQINRNVKKKIEKMNNLWKHFVNIIINIINIIICYHFYHSNTVPATSDCYQNYRYYCYHHHYYYYCCCCCCCCSHSNVKSKKIKNEKRRKRNENFYEEKNASYRSEWEKEKAREKAKTMEIKKKKTFSRFFFWTFASNHTVKKKVNFRTTWLHLLNNPCITNKLSQHIYFIILKYHFF